MSSANFQSNILILEGNIGAGKSTFLNILKENLDIDIIPEPTDRWQKIGADDNLLDLFYKDTPRWAYTFQSYAFITRVQALLDYQKNFITKPIQVLERSVYCDRYCFAKNCFESGSMSKLEWEIYKDWFAWLVESYIPQPRGFIYLQTTPETCFNRIAKRSRCEESNIPLSYLESLHTKHEDWLIQKKGLVRSLESTPVLTIDCNEDFENNTKRQMELLEQVRNFIKNEITIVQPLVQKATQTQL